MPPWCWQATAVHTQCLISVLFYRRKEVSREDQGIQPQDRSVQWQGNLWSLQRREGVHLWQATTEDSRHRDGKIIILWWHLNPSIWISSPLIFFVAFKYWYVAVYFPDIFVILTSPDFFANAGKQLRLVSDLFSEMPSKGLWLSVKSSQGSARLWHRGIGKCKLCKSFL